MRSFKDLVSKENQVVSSLLCLVEKIEGVPEGSIVELTNCVYGLMDAPRHWWTCLSKTLRGLGLKQIMLDPCVFFWHSEGKLQGVVAVHVDDLVLGALAVFMKCWGS